MDIEKIGATIALTAALTGSPLALAKDTESSLLPPLKPIPGVTSAQDHVASIVENIRDRIIQEQVIQEQAFSKKYGSLIDEIEKTEKLDPNEARIELSFRIFICYNGTLDISHDRIAGHNYSRTDIAIDKNTKTITIELFGKDGAQVIYHDKYLSPDEKSYMHRLIIKFYDPETGITHDVSNNPEYQKYFARSIARLNKWARSREDCKKSE